MSLTNFGSILNFAEELEKADGEMYTAWAGNPECARAKPVFEQIAGQAAKNLKEVQRTRRENVTEMILENIEGLSKENYRLEAEDASGMNPAKMTLEQALQHALRLEDRAERYYTDAAAGMKAQPEVSRALKTLAKKRIANRKKLETR